MIKTRTLTGFDVASRIFLTMTLPFVVIACSQKSPNYVKQTMRHSVVSQKNSMPNRYQVKAGDTVSKIAQAYGLSWRELSLLNGLDDKHTIHVGQWLVLQDNTVSKKVSTLKNKKMTINQSSSPVIYSSSYANSSVGSYNTSYNSNTGYNSSNAYALSQNTVQHAYSTPKTYNTSQNFAQSPSQNTSQALVGSSALMRFEYPVGKNNSVARQFATPTNHGLTEGMFFAGRAGDLVKASLGGQVIHADTNTARPMIAIQHTDGYVSTYFDLQNIQVRQGQSVSKGETLGVMNAQTPSGVALFEFRIAKDGKLIDPVSVMR